MEPLIDWPDAKGKAKRKMNLCIDINDDKLVNWNLVQNE